MASNDDSLSFKCFDFQPYRGFPRNTNKINLLTRILTWLQTTVFTDQDVAVVVAIAPGHSPTSSGQVFLHGLIKELIENKAGKVQDGTGLLKRTEEVQKSTEGGPRDQSLHEETIEVTDPSQVKDKVVYIIDDIWTTGATLRACASLMRKAGASDVKMVAVGKTVGN